jgi:hypothetical protein
MFNTTVAEIVHSYPFHPMGNIWRLARGKSACGTRFGNIGLSDQCNL